MLDKALVGSILGDDKPSVGEHGAVTAVIARTDQIELAGYAVDPGLNVSSNVAFQLLPNGQTAAAADFAMTSEEVQPVLKRMRGQGWDVHCLHNQETGQQPQLYFAHMLKVGDTQALARYPRRARPDQGTRRLTATSRPTTVTRPVRVVRAFISKCL